ncbi:MAG TPA: tRNA (adenosine(37)-N6)-threonylcarbamoyltransferase complex dimerization subunit type 1 TsaB [Candidatus Limnocylindrales bacterium]|nr:tRNA (adenosine(37)-N6)-threonylcarbamoyltransferase complex dimerization subunit type 1 TsaB [Candidatus Limnocylindrales bacterium]
MTGDAGSGDGRRRWLLAIDTATSEVVVAAGSLDGDLLGATLIRAGHRHGEVLLPAIGRLQGEVNLRRSRIEAIVVGTGPGAFTGLRVGIATAKALAHALGRPIVGVSTGEALVEAARGLRGAGEVVLLLPAGPSDRVVVRAGTPPSLLPGGIQPELAESDVVVALDLEGRAPDAAVERGEVARRGLAGALVRLGAARLAAGHGDDLARLVPEYVTLPRGVRAPSGEVVWSRGPR